MFLQHRASGDLVEVLTIDNLYDPCQDKIVGRFHVGEEMQDPQDFPKSDIIFPSGEPLPHCWVDPDYHRQAA